MSNQPRPWFRLPSIARPAAPAPTPSPEPSPPQPRPAPIRPAFRPVAPPQPAAGIASVPTSPAVKAAGGVASLPPSPASREPAPSASVPTSPSPKLAPSASVLTSPSTKPVTTTTSSVPSSPSPKTTTVTSLVPNSPAAKAVTPAQLVIVKPAVQTPPRSPNPKPTAAPPSPLTLPPSRVKSDADLEPKIPLVAEKKTVLVQKIIDKPKEAGDSLRAFADNLSSGIARYAKQETAKDQTKEKGSGKKISSDPEDVGMRVITIAGENKGAFMEVIRSPKKHFFEGNSHTLHMKGNPRREGSDWGSQSSSGEEGNSRKKDKNHRERSMGPSPMSAFMNSNVQGVNNSIVYDSSCTHHDPGCMFLSLENLLVLLDPMSRTVAMATKAKGNKE
uniref:Uncharacterized protein n=1 Tax=Salix viminalis TaxID=40686 RepID=A0A6N2L0R2_SALVM